MSARFVITPHGIIVSDGSQVIDQATAQIVYYTNNLGETSIIIAEVGDNVECGRQIG